MINTGYGFVKFLECDKGCSAKTAVFVKFEFNVVKQYCNQYTNKNYVGLIMGSRDSITFNLLARCVKCNCELRSDTTKIGFETDFNSRQRYKCRKSISFEYEYSANTYFENRKNYLIVFKF